MVHAKKLYLNIYWHMHQPDYRDVTTGKYVLPWTYLHALKDYTDMAFHLEINQGARVTFNYVPVLLDQLEDYVEQFSSGHIRDPLLELLGISTLDEITDDQRKLILESCFKGYHEKMLAPFPEYQHLHHIYLALEKQGNLSTDYLSTQYLADLLVWYHLAWTGESLRRNNRLIQKLLEKRSHFTDAERLSLFKLIGSEIKGLIPRYKKLQKNGQIELTTTPHHHPILPLLLDFKSTHDAMPGADLPKTISYPGGRTRAISHIQSAIKTHHARFGDYPKGVWPSEGSISLDALSLLAENGFHWAATGENVLANSLRLSQEELPARETYLYQPYQVTDGIHDIVCFFRDDVLSDKIGFEYSKQYAGEAVSDFVRNLEDIYEKTEEQGFRVVSVILDGENAWEYYPYNGYYFLSELYAALVSHPYIEMKTPSQILALYQETKQQKTKENQYEALEYTQLKEISAGSWVYGTFSTWIGSPDKNLAWDLLCEAKQHYDHVMQVGTLSAVEKEACERQLAICEGSDWFWWFGDYNSSISVASFDRLYRLNLSNLYKLLKLAIPKSLNKPISEGQGDPAMGGTMRKGQA